MVPTSDANRVVPSPEAQELSKAEQKPKTFQNRIDDIADRMMLAFQNTTTHIGRTLVDLNNRRRDLQGRIITWVKDKFTAAVRVFVFTFTPSPFDPKSKEFVEIVQSISKRYSTTKFEADSLSEGFHSKPNFFANLDTLNVCYHNTKETVRQLQEFLEELKLYKKPFPIQAEVEKLLEGYNEIDKTLELKIKDKTAHVLNVFSEICANDFKVGVLPMLNEVKEYFLKHGHIINKIFIEGKNLEPYLTRRFSEYLHKIENESVEEIVYNSPSIAKTPMALRNIGNSCYMDAALEALFCFDEARKKLVRKLTAVSHEMPPNANLPHIRDGYEFRVRQAQEQLVQRKDLQRHLINLVNNPISMGSSSIVEYILGLNQNNPMYQVRDAFFRTKLVHEFSLDHGPINDQRDSASVVDVVMDHILEERFQTQRVSSTDDIPGRVFYSESPAEEPSLKIDVGNTPTSLQDLINKYFSVETQINNDPKIGTRKFIPSEGIIFDENAAKGIKTPLDQPVAPEKFATFLRIKKLPDFIAINLTRFTDTQHKNNTPVSLPSDFILDFKNATFALEDNESTLYEVMSTVVHGGSLAGGHYTSDVRIGDKFYHCDDASDKPYHECSAIDFNSEKNSVVVMARRIKNTSKSNPSN